MENKEINSCTGSCASCHESCGSGTEGPGKIEQFLNTIGNIDEDELLDLINKAMDEAQKEESEE